MIYTQQRTFTLQNLPDIIHFIKFTFIINFFHPPYIIHAQHRSTNNKIKATQKSENFKLRFMCNRHTMHVVLLKMKFIIFLPSVGDDKLLRDIIKSSLCSSSELMECFCKMSDERLQSLKLEVCKERENFS